MGIPRLNSCCCGCSLRTGTLILLYLTLIACVLYPFEKPMKDDKGNSTVPETPTSVKIANAVVGTVISLAGLYGVYTERHGFLLPYLIYDTIAVIALLVLTVLAFLLTFIGGIFFLIFALLPIYFWLVVYNHYLDLQEGRGSSSAA